MRGYGKVILFGEHAVVYGYPALAAGLSQGIACHVTDERLPCFTLDVPQWKLVLPPDDPSPLGEALRIILRGLPPKEDGRRLIITPEVPSRAGLGSSAALIVSIIRALLDWHNLHWPLEKINELAFQAECAFHGTPSGLDNTVATFGGLCYLSDRDRYPCPFSPTRTFLLKKFTAALLPGLPEAVSFVIINTKKDRETKALVAKVRALIEQKPEYYHGLMAKIGAFAAQGYSCLQQKNYQKFGEMMNRNHQYLRELGVSSPELERLVEVTLASGALGAKLTGAGGGGCLLAFGPGKETDIVHACHQAGFETFIAEIH